MSDPSTQSSILKRVERSSREIVRRLQRLLDIGTALSAEQDLAKLLAIILKESRAVTGADSGSVFIRENETRINPNATARDEIQTVIPHLVIKVAQNDSINFPFREMKLPFDEKTIAGHVAFSGKIVNLADVYKVPPGMPFSYNPSFDKAAGYRCMSMLAIPMRNRDGDIIGVIQLINKKKAPDKPLADPKKVEKDVVTFDEVDEELVLSLASQAAVCIEKAMLYDQLSRTFDGMVTSFTHSLEKRNKTTHGHCTRVCAYAVAIAEAVNKHAKSGRFGGVTYSPEQLQELRYAALLHDIGKIGVPEAILDKINKLTDAEMEAVSYRFHYWRTRLQKELGDAAKERVENLDRWLQTVRKANVPRFLSDEDADLLKEIRAARFMDVDGQEKSLLTDHEYENLIVRKGNLTPGERKFIEQHIVDTWDILKGIPWPKNLRQIPHLAATHHEKLDGSGYPWKMKAEEIPLGGKILAIVDIYEALTAKDRPYKPAMPVEKALQIVKSEVDAGHLDKNLFNLFVEEKIHLLFSSAETGFVHRPQKPPS